MFVAAAAALVLSADGLQADEAADHPATRPARATPLAVLGDSDSHSYQDYVSFPAGSGKRGGAWRATTLQWTDVLARLRAQDIDPGPWGVWGVPRPVARLQQWMGLGNRAPRKQDYRYNFAISGAGCETLASGGARQAQRLIALMDHEPQRWRSGVIVVRIGVNSFGMEEGLERLARDPMDAATQREVAGCIEQVRRTVALVHEKHPQTHFVLVGIFDNANWPRYFARWQSAAEVANIARGLDVYDRALAAMAAQDARLAFFDDREWFARRWGGRDERGRPAYRVLSLDSGFRVENSIGDDPRHAVIGDGHAGLVWNVLWAQSLVALMKDRFGTDVAPIDDHEVTRFIERTLAEGR